MTNTSTLTFLGVSGISAANTEIHLETFECDPRLSTVRMTSDEVVGFCPVTAQPDFYVVNIDYGPDKLCIESKSLKLYLQQPLFNQTGIFAESLAVKIAEDIDEACKPVWVSVKVTQKPRGGISIEAVSTISRGLLDQVEVE